MEIAAARRVASPYQAPAFPWRRTALVLGALLAFAGAAGGILPDLLALFLTGTLLAFCAPADVTPYGSTIACTVRSIAGSAATLAAYFLLLVTFSPTAGLLPGFLALLTLALPLVLAERVGDAARPV